MVRRLIEIFDEKQKHTYNCRGTVPVEGFGHKWAGVGFLSNGQRALSSYGRSYRDFAENMFVSFQ